MSVDRVGMHTLFERGSPVKSKKDFSCHHYFGYLSKYSKDIDYPDECLICPNAVNCIFVPSDNQNAEFYFKAVKEKENRELAQLL